MNPETGQIYRGEAEIAAARARGERLVQITEAQARMAEEINAITSRRPQSGYTPEQKLTRADVMARLKAEQPELNRRQRRQKARRAVKA